MSKMRTFCIIKPDATKRNITGLVNAHLEEKGFKIIAQRLIRLTPMKAAEFYAEHEGAAYYEALIEYMTSAPIIVQVLWAEDAVLQLRKVIGKTDPSQAEAGTIRNLYGQNTRENTIHASDSPESAAREIALFFDEDQIHI